MILILSMEIGMKLVILTKNRSLQKCTKEKEQVILIHFR